MTNIQQYLTYIHNELKFMAMGNAITGGGYSNAKFANRVIDDVCDIPNFCTSVLSSKKPGEVIMAVLKGPRGNFLMRFFDEQLHKARVELVNVLAVTSHLMSNTTSLSVKKPKKSYAELYKLYTSSVKEIRKMIKNQNSKKSLETMYPTLKALTGIGIDYDYDDDEGDYDDEDYVNSWFEAARNGTEFPRPLSRTPKPTKATYDLTGNDDLVEMIRRIQLRFGRSLSTKEIMSILEKIEKSDKSEPEDEETGDNEVSFKPLFSTSTVDPGFMNQLANMVIAKLSMRAEADEVEDTRPTITNDLDEFLDKVNNPQEPEVDDDQPLPETVIVDSNKNPDSSKPTTMQPQKFQVTDPNKISTKTLIKMRNDEKVDTAESSEKPTEKEPADNSAEEDSSEQQGPDEQSGPEYALGETELNQMVEDIKEKSHKNNTSESINSFSEPEMVSEDEEELDRSAGVDKEELESEREFPDEDQLHQPEEETPERTQYSYQAQQIAEKMNPNYFANLVDGCKNAIKPIIENGGAEFKELRVFTTPAWGGEYVINLDCFIVIDGDVNDIDNFAIVRQTSTLAEKFAKLYQINSKRINVKTSVTSVGVISGKYENPFEEKICELSLPLTFFEIGTYMALLFFEILKKPVDIRYIGSSDRLTIYINFNSDDYNQIKEVNDILMSTLEVRQYIDKQCLGNIQFVSQVMESNEMLDMHFDKSLLDALGEGTNGMMVKTIIESEKIKTMNYLTTLFSQAGIENIDIMVDASQVSARDRAGYEINYNVDFKGNLSANEVQDIKQDFENCHSAYTEIRELLLPVSANVLIESYLTLSQVENEESINNEVPIAPNATNAFGM